MKHNAAIYLLSSRVLLLEKCLINLYKNWNFKYDYPVYIHYFNNIYNEKFKKKIKDNISKKIFFYQIDYSVPDHIDEKDLFYNRTYLQYVKKSFPKSRLGFLHGERFWTNITSFGKKGCLVKELSDYDYLMRIDDDSNFKKKIDFDLFDGLKNHNVCSGYLYNDINSRILDTRQELWSFYKNYIKKFNYQPVNTELRKALENDDEMMMHKLFWTSGNCNLYNMNKFKNNFKWDEYLNELNRFGGDYKYRWGDIETIGLFIYTHFEKGPLDLKIKEHGFYDNKFPTFLSSYAPGTDNKLNVHNSFFLRTFWNIKLAIKKRLFGYKIEDEFNKKK